MESLELDQVLSIQRMLFMSAVSISIITVIWAILNYFMSEKVKVSLSKRTKKEKISLSESFAKSSKDSSVTIHKSSQKTNTSENNQDLTETRATRRQSIFDLKDL
ncbi:MAG: hypothetical protein ABDH21_02000 [bacterium]